MIRFFRDERFKYTLIEYLYPFLIFASIDIISIILISLFKFWNFFNPFSVLKFIVMIGFLTLLILSFRPFRDFFTALFYCHKVEEFDNSIVGGHFNMFEGCPGTGKSVSIAYIDFMKAKRVNIDMNFKSIIIKTKTRCGYDYKDYEEILKDREILKAYYYYSNDCGIPFLITNYGIKDKYSERFSYKLDKKYLLQLEKLPESSVCSYDEFARDFNCKNSMSRDENIKKDNELLNDFSSKLRHYGNFVVDMAEQEGSEILKDVRRVTSLFRKLLQLDKVCESQRIEKKLNKIKNLVLKHQFCSDKLYRKYTKYESLSNKIGFMRIYFQDRRSKDEGTSVINEGYYVLPKNLPFEYETRCFFFDYKAMDKDINLEVFKSLYNG